MKKSRQSLHGPLAPSPSYACRTRLCSLPCSPLAWKPVPRRHSSISGCCKPSATKNQAASKGFVRPVYKDDLWKGKALSGLNAHHRGVSPTWVSGTPPPTHRAPIFPLRKTQISFSRFRHLIWSQKLSTAVSPLSLVTRRDILSLKAADEGHTAVSHHGPTHNQAGSLSATCFQ